MKEKDKETLMKLMDILDHDIRKLNGVYSSLVRTTFNQVYALVKSLSVDQQLELYRLQVTEPLKTKISEQENTIKEMSEQLKALANALDLITDRKQDLVYVIYNDIHDCIELISNDYNEVRSLVTRYVTRNELDISTEQQIDLINRAMSGESYDLTVSFYDPKKEVHDLNG